MARGITQSALLVAIAIVLALAIIALATMSRPASVDERCRFRLFRLGGAVNAWVEDHGHHSFPRILNPSPQALWLPGRIGSAGLVLWNYLGGDIPSPAHPNETQEQFAERLRGNELSVCPASGTEYWYDDQTIGSTTPNDLLSRQPPEIRYFHCQQVNGHAPHHHHGQDGAFAVYGLLGAGGGQILTKADVVAMHGDLKRLEADTAIIGSKDRQERIDQLRTRIGALEQEMGTNGQVEMKRLSAEVRFGPSVP
jgi:hypothetical protein